jgi:hypothetical protein
MTSTATTTTSEYALPDPPTDGITRVLFAPDANRLLVSSWDAVRQKRRRRTHSIHSIFIFYFYYSYYSNLFMFYSRFVCMMSPVPAVPVAKRHSNTKPLCSTVSLLMTPLLFSLAVWIDVLKCKFQESGTFVFFFFFFFFFFSNGFSKQKQVRCCVWQ